MCAAPMEQQSQGLRELHAIIEFREADNIAAAAAAVAVEKLAARVDQETGFVILMQRAQPHPPSAGERPLRTPLVRFEIGHERNLPLQLVESLTIHGLLASTGRIRQRTLRSQTSMVGKRKKGWVKMA